MAKSKKSAWRYAVAFPVAIVSDLIDYAVVGMIPGLGDILDVVTTAILTVLLGPLALAGLIELVPGLDAIPTYTILVGFSYLRNKGKK